MILGFGTTPAEQRRLETLSSAVEDLHVVVSWDALYEPCALRVVAAADLSDRALIDRVTQLRHVDAFAPLVLLTDPHPENLVHLAGIIVDRVGWLKTTNLSGRRSLPQKDGHLTCSISFIASAPATGFQST
jgi:hypothetical protein